MKNDLENDIQEQKGSVSKQFIDQYGNILYTTDELSRGGQGVVFRTKDPDLAIKQPLDENGEPDIKSNLQSRFQNIRLLPLPAGIPVTLPLSITKNEPGYVMRLLNGMKPIGCLHLGGKEKKELSDVQLPHWLQNIPDKDMALKLFHYARTGGCKSRFDILFKTAAILARLHDAGLVYGDVSLNNIFMESHDNPAVWLIDADNLRFEKISGGGGTYTPRLGAPEIVQGKDASRPRSDCWAYSVMAFELLALTHPFIGAKVLGEDGDGDDWDAETSDNDSGMQLEEQAYSGFFPYIDDEDDDSNEAPNLGLPRMLLFSNGLRQLFQETFGAGRLQPHRRPGMAFWAVEFAKAHDQSITCQNCGMSYFPTDHEKCPYCDAEKSCYLRISTKTWTYFVQDHGEKTVILPERVFLPFSLKTCNVPLSEIIVDFNNKKVSPERGFVLPEGATFEFVEDEDEF